MARRDFENTLRVNELNISNLIMAEDIKLELDGDGQNSLERQEDPEEADKVDPADAPDAIQQDPGPLKGTPRNPLPLLNFPDNSLNSGMKSNQHLFATPKGPTDLYQLSHRSADVEAGGGTP